MTFEFFKKIVDKKSFFVICIVIFLIYTSLCYQNKALSFHFVDEEDNFVIGKYMLGGERLYSDLFSHHQPLGYILSESIQKLTDPNSIYLLVKRHREALIIWSLLWGTFLTIKFGFAGFFSVTFYELTKYRLLGHLFLSESLVVYPIAFISLLVMDKKKLSDLGSFGIGFLFSLCFSLLSPIWPLLSLLILFLVLNQNKKRRFGIFFGLGFLPIIIIVLRSIDFSAYLLDAFWINFKYYIPITSHDGPLMVVTKATLTPIISWFVSDFSTPTLWLIRFFSLALVLNLIVFLKKKMNKEVLIVILMLTLANIRYTTPGLEIFGGFHILIWYGLLIFLTSWLSVKNYQNFVYSFRITIVACLALSLVLAVKGASEGLFQKDDQDTKYYINYSRQFIAGEIVRIIKFPEDALFVAPDEWLVYYQADIKHASKMINYYAWMDHSPELSGEVAQLFQYNPPTFLYINMPGTGFDKYFPNYVRFRREGHDIDLLVKPERLNSLSEDQKQHLRFLNIEI